MRTAIINIAVTENTKLISTVNDKTAVIVFVIKLDLYSTLLDTKDLILWWEEIFNSTELM